MFELVASNFGKVKNPFTGGRLDDVNSTFPQSYPQKF